jgi:hypothetical protein
MESRPRRDFLLRGAKCRMNVGTVMTAFTTEK